MTEEVGERVWDVYGNAFVCFDNFVNDAFNALKVGDAFDVSCDFDAICG